MRNNHCHLPGRWMSKKNIEEWMENYHPDPGYSNFLRQKWLEKQKKSNLESLPRPKK